MGDRIFYAQTVPHLFFSCIFKLCGTSFSNLTISIKSLLFVLVRIGAVMLFDLCCLRLKGCCNGLRHHVLNIANCVRDCIDLQGKQEMEHDLIITHQLYTNWHRAVIHPENIWAFFVYSSVQLSSIWITHQND